MAMIAMQETRRYRTRPSLCSTLVISPPAKPLISARPAQEGLFKSSTSPSYVLPVSLVSILPKEPSCIPQFGPGQDLDTICSTYVQTLNHPDICWYPTVECIHLHTRRCAIHTILGRSALDHLQAGQKLESRQKRRYSVFGMYRLLCSRYFRRLFRTKPCNCYHWIHHCGLGLRHASFFAVIPCLTLWKELLWAIIRGHRRSGDNR